MVNRVQRSCSKWLIRVPFRSGIFGEQPMDLVKKRGRRFVTAEKTQSGGAVCSPGPPGRGEFSQKRLPGANLPIVNYRLRAVRVEQGQQLGLHKNVAGPETRRVIRI